MFLVRWAIQQKQQRITPMQVSKAMFWTAMIFVMWHVAHWEPTATGNLGQHGLGGMAVLEMMPIAEVGGSTAGK
jgi:hypothetical protein